MLNDLKNLFSEPKILPLVIFVGICILSIVGAFIKMIFDVSRDNRK
jgi:hypothetical protein